MSRKLSNTLNVRDVVCDNIRVTKSGSDTFVATFGFSDRCGLYGDILEIVKGEKDVKGCIIDPSCSTIYCDPLSISSKSVVRIPGSENTIVSPHIVGEVCESHPVFCARVNVTFKDVSIRPNEFMGDGIWMVEYKSFEVTALSTPCAWSYDPMTRYGPLGVSRIDVDKLTRFESIRDNM